MIVQHTARKQLRRLDRRYAKKLMEALNAYEQDQKGDVKKLVNRDGYRLRVGDYRAIFDIEDGELIVFEVGSRGDIY